MSWFKIYNLWRQPAPKNAATIDKYLPYGHSDAFPLELDQAISESESATSCLSTVQDFIEGFGFSDSELEKLKINSKGETFWQFHQQTVDSWAEFEGFYWLLRYNALGAITEIEFLAFENCRLGQPDSNGYISHIYYNPFFGTKDFKGSDKKQTKCYDVFNPNAVKAQILEQKGAYKGQVFFFGTTTARSRYYPKPKVTAALKWMKIEAGVADYHEDRIDNGFLQDYILVMKGNPSDPSTNPDFANENGEGKPATVAQEFDAVMEENFMGKGKHANMMVQWVNNSDEKPETVAIPSSANSDLFLNLDNQATKKITIAFGVPSILANISEGVSLGGDGNMVRVAVKLMQQRVIKKQRVLTDNYQKILSIFVTPYKKDITIVPYNPYPELEILDDKIWDALTPEEQRQWINENTGIELNTTETPEPIEEPSQQVAKFTNSIPIAFNDKIKATIKRALDYQDKMGQCSGKGGRAVSQMILDNKPMGLKQLKRIYNFLKKNELEYNKPFNEGCKVVEYASWGGKDMQDFLEEELKRLNAWLN